MTLNVYLAVIVVVLLIVVAMKRRKRALSDPAPSRRTFSVGPGASGTIYDLLNEERRNAIEIIVEEKAAYRDPEDADGNLPDLEKR